MSFERMLFVVTVILTSTGVGTTLMAYFMELELWVSVAGAMLFVSAPVMYDYIQVTLPRTVSQRSGV